MQKYQKKDRQADKDYKKWTKGKEIHKDKFTVCARNENKMEIVTDRQKEGMQDIKSSLTLSMKQRHKTDIKKQTMKHKGQNDSRSRTADEIKENKL